MVERFACPVNAGSTNAAPNALNGESWLRPLPHGLPVYFAPAMCVAKPQQGLAKLRRFHLRGNVRR